MTGFAAASPTQISIMPHVLIAEDEPLLSKILQRGLAQSSYQVSIVADGAAAIAAVQAEPMLFQCIVMDIVMPKVDGIQAAQTISQFNPNLPIILITAGATPDLPEHLPIVALLHKPFRIDTLVHMIALHTQRNR